MSLRVRLRLIDTRFKIKDIKNMYYQFHFTSNNVLIRVHQLCLCGRKEYLALSLGQSRSIPRPSHTGQAWTAPSSNTECRPARPGRGINRLVTSKYLANVFDTATMRSLYNVNKVKEATYSYSFRGLKSSRGEDEVGSSEPVTSAMLCS